MKTKILFGILMALLILGTPFGQALQLQSGASASVKGEANAGKDASAGVSAESRASVGVKESSEERSETAKAAIEKRADLLASLKLRLLNATPEERSERARQINRERIEGLREIRGLIKNPDDIRAFEKAKLNASMELCKENLGDAQDKDKCEKEIEAEKEKLGKLTDGELEKLKKLEEKTGDARKFGKGLLEIEGLKKFKIKLTEDASGQIKLDVQARELPEEKLKSIKDAIENLQADGLKLKFQESKNGFFGLKAKAESCRDNTDECKKSQEQLKIAAKEVLIKAIDFLLAKLEKAKLTVQAEASLTSEESAQLTAKIDGQIAAVKQLKEKAEKMTAETDKKTVQELAKEINKKIEADIKVEIETTAGFVSASRAGGILVKSARLLEKMNKAVENLALEKKATAELEAFAADFRTQIENVKTQFVSVQEKFKAASEKTGEERKQAVKDAQDGLSGLKEKLKGLQEKLKDYLKALKEKGSLRHIEETRADLAVEANEKAVAEATVEVEQSNITSESRAQGDATTT